MTKEQLIRLIHIAKSQLKLDDETYRTKLEALTGKSSCSDMTIAMLNDVYQSFKDAGFKRKFNKQKAHVSPNAKGETKAAEIPKIRAIWITMHEQNFVSSAGEPALNAYVMRMTKRLNGIGVAEVGWLDDRLAYKVLETLKNWHLRLMLDELKKRRVAIPTDSDGRERRSYDWIAPIYSRIAQLDSYINRCREGGDNLLPSNCTRCGFRHEVVAPRDRAEKWDSVMCCPVCCTQFHRTTTCHSVITRAIR